MNSTFKSKGTKLLCLLAALAISLTAMVACDGGDDFSDDEVTKKKKKTSDVVTNDDYPTVSPTHGISSQTDFSGYWYYALNEGYNFKSDKTVTYIGSDSSVGTWDVSSDKKTITLTISGWYTQTYSGTISNDELGVWAKLSEQISIYKDSYPSNAQFEAYKEKHAKRIDPFEGLTFTATGISPYCSISLNNVACSSDVQKYVSYTLDKKQYANGDAIKVTATLAENTDGVDYLLTATEKEYSLSNMPEYITSIEGLDLTNLKAELADYITAEKAKAEGYDRSHTDLFSFYYYVGGYITNIVAEQTDLYMQSLKATQWDDSGKTFNYLTFVCKMSFQTKAHGDESIATCISCANVVKYPDGTIKWGKNSPEDLDFIAESTDHGVESAISSFITIHASDYNITELDIAK